MKRFCKIVIWIVGSAVAYCFVTFLIGLYDGWSKRVRETTFFGVTLGDKRPEYKYDQYRFEKNFNMINLNALQSDFAMEYQDFSLAKNFYDAYTGTLFWSRHDEKVYAIIVCCEFNNWDVDKMVKEITGIFEQKHNCTAHVIDREPIYIRELFRNPKLITSTNSCCIATPHSFVSIFGFYQPRDKDGTWTNIGGRVFIMVNTPDFPNRVAKEKILNEQDKHREMKNKRDEAFDAL